MTIPCNHCGSPIENCTYEEIFTGEPLCFTCARREVIVWLADCEHEELKILKDRVIKGFDDHPAELIETIAGMVVRNRIYYEDCV